MESQGTNNVRIAKLSEDFGRHPCFVSKSEHAEVVKAGKIAEVKLLQSNLVQGYETIIIRIDRNHSSIESSIVSDAAFNIVIDDLNRGLNTGDRSSLTVAIRTVKGTRGYEPFAYTANTVNDDSRIRGRYDFLLKSFKICALLYGKLPDMTEKSPSIKQLMWWLRRYVEAGYQVSQPVLAYLLSPQNQMDNENEKWDLPIIVNPKAQHSECLPLMWDTNKPPVYVQRRLRVNAKGELRADQRRIDAASRRGKSHIPANRKRNKKNDGDEPSTAEPESPTST